MSDGIIAGGYEPEAIEILKQKVRIGLSPHRSSLLKHRPNAVLSRLSDSLQKGGKYIVLQAKRDYTAPDNEVKEVFGVALSQKRCDVFGFEKGPPHLAHLRLFEKKKTTPYYFPPALVVIFSSTATMLSSQRI